MKSRLLEATIASDGPSAGGSSTLQNPASLFSDALLRLRVSTEDNSPIESDEGVTKPPKYVRPSTLGRPRFASASSLSRLPGSAGSATQQVDHTSKNPFYLITTSG